MESRISVVNSQLVLVETFGEFELAALMEVAEQALETCTRHCIDRILIDSSCAGADIVRFVSELQGEPVPSTAIDCLQIAMLGSNAVRHVQAPFAEIMNLTGIATIFLDEPEDARTWLQAEAPVAA